MKKYTGILLPLIVLFGSVAAGAQTSGAETDAVVYFYRVREVAGIDNRKAKVKIDGVNFFEMPQAKWIGFRIAPGKYAVEMRQKQSEMLLNAKAGNIYFIRVSEKTGGFTYNQSLTVMDREQAIFQMRDLPALELKRIFVKTARLVADKPVEENK